MLIDSPRLTNADRAHWAKLERYDAALATEDRRSTMAADAAQVVAQFVADGPCFAGVSWGKDSVVVAHLIAAHQIAVPLVWVRVERWENPDCETVRDAFLSRWPDVRYDEITVPSTSPRRWEPPGPTSRRTSRGGFSIAEKRWGARHISGVRSEESGERRLTVARNGLASVGSCRPIARWTAVDVFAHLAAHDLPVHPAYAMSMGGIMDRRRLRVGSLGGDRGAGNGRVEWEHRYYGDLLPPEPGATR